MTTTWRSKERPRLASLAKLASKVGSTYQHGRSGLEVTVVREGRRAG